MLYCSRGCVRNVVQRKRRGELSQLRHPPMMSAKFLCLIGLNLCCLQACRTGSRSNMTEAGPQDSNDEARFKASTCVYFQEDKDYLKLTCSHHGLIVIENESISPSHLLELANIYQCDRQPVSFSGDISVDLQKSQILFSKSCDPNGKDFVGLKY